LHQNYYCNGNICEEYFHNGNKLEGLYKKFSKNGELSECCNYLNGNLNGEYKIYWSSGELFSITMYDNGLIQKIIKIFSRKGEEGICQLDENEEDYGFKKEYDENGNLTKNIMFCMKKTLEFYSIKMLENTMQNELVYYNKEK
jgi:antitoxin component YwqK of YwqJK toxin-antitoxin module